MLSIEKVVSIMTLVMDYAEMNTVPLMIRDLLILEKK